LWANVLYEAYSTDLNRKLSEKKEETKKERKKERKQKRKGFKINKINANRGYIKAIQFTKDDLKL